MIRLAVNENNSQDANEEEHNGLNALISAAGRYEAARRCRASLQMLQRITHLMRWYVRVMKGCPGSESLRLLYLPQPEENGTRPDER